MGPDEDPAFPVPTFQAFPSLPVKLEVVDRPCQSQAHSNVVSANLRGWMKTFQSDGRPMASGLVSHNHRR